jgi:hypothetical protein
MKLIIEQDTKKVINLDLDEEALALDDYALADFIENAIHLLKCHLTNLTESLE